MCRSTRSTALLTDQVTDPAPALHASIGSRPSPAARWSDQTFRHGPIEGSTTADWDNSGYGRTAVGDNNLVAFADASQIVAQLAAQLFDPDFHGTSVHAEGR